MNITTELKPKDDKLNLIINGCEVGLFTVPQLKQHIKRFDNIIHHKSDVTETYPDHFKVIVRGLDLGDWEISQIRQHIQDIDRYII